MIVGTTQHTIVKTLVYKLSLTFDNELEFVQSHSRIRCIKIECTLKLGIHLRQRQGSLSFASVVVATNQATCLRGCRSPSHRLSIDQSEASPRNSPPHLPYGWNMPRLAETEKHSLIRGMSRMLCRASACLCL